MCTTSSKRVLFLKIEIKPKTKGFSGDTLDDLCRNSERENARDEKSKTRLCTLLAIEINGNTHIPILQSTAFEKITKNDFNLLPRETQID